MRAKSNQYLMQCACFEGRKVFKQPLPQIEEERAVRLCQRLSGRKPTASYQDSSHVCPQCSKPLTLMGRAFRAPKRGDTDQWRKVEILARNGFIFWSNTGAYPDTATGVKKFVIEKRKRSQGEKLVQKIAKAHRNP